ncbi:MAG: histidine phosphatase family protein [Roseburia sp.]|nr:histidine phosphatase family protein [Roseburia sp.]
MRNFTENQIELFLIRHGKTKANQEKRYLGKTEENLSEQGKKELEEKTYPLVQYLFGSPMERCRQTAELLYPNLPYHIIPEWKEMDFGRFEGKNYEDLKDDMDYQKWIDSNGTLPFPEGESREEFIFRCGRGLKRFLELVINWKIAENAPIGAVVHGGTIMALLSRYGAQGDYFDFQCKNGEGYHCFVKFSVGEDGEIRQDSIRMEKITALSDAGS